ncbi:MAG: PAS domain S-box protein [Alphaproteobacteria bacterium]|nr:PAS domain S-box protein [Alphaproteobacteria bacterium]
MKDEGSKVLSLGHDAEVQEDSLLHRNVLESMSEGVLTVAGGGRIGILNPAASRLLGLDGAEVRGRTLAEVLMDREDLEAFNDIMLAAVYDEAVGSRSTIRLRSGEGAERSVAVTTSYLVNRRDGEDRRIGLVAVLDDVTEVEALAEATAAQNAELRDAYREIEEKNSALDSALKKMTAVRVLAMLLVAVLFAGAAWYVWDEAGAAFTLGSAGPSAGAQDKAVTVTVAPRRLLSTVSFVGKLEPRREVPVTSQVSGKVARVFFEYGDRVEKGQPLVELEIAETDRRHFEAQTRYFDARDKLRELEDWENSPEIARARRALTLAGMEFEARRGKLAETALLLEQGVIPASEHKAAERQYEGQRLRYEAAQQDLEAARAKVDADAVRIARLRLENAERQMLRLEETQRGALVVAPVPGIVLEPGSKSGRRSGEDSEGRPVTEGRLVSQGGYLLSIADLGGLTVAGGIDEVDVVKVHAGQRVRIAGDAFPGLVFEGRIARVAPQSRSKGNARVPVFDVTAAIDRLTEEHLAQLRLGMSANVTIVVRDEPSALLVPLAAVQGGPGNYRVRLKDKDGGAPRTVRVKAGETTLYEVEIVGGLKAGDEVIVSGS